MGPSSATMFARPGFATALYTTPKYMTLNFVNRISFLVGYIGVPFTIHVPPISSAVVLKSL